MADQRWNGVNQQRIKTATDKSQPDAPDFYLFFFQNGDGATPATPYLHSEINNRRRRDVNVNISVYSGVEF